MFTTDSKDISNDNKWDAMNDFDRLWKQIMNLAGESFHTKTGKLFSYDCSGSTVQLRNTNRALPKSQFAKAAARSPLSGPGVLQDLQGPSYLYAILADPRVSASTSPLQVVPRSRETATRSRRRR